MSDEFRDYMREQRGRPVVLKAELAAIGSTDKCALVIVLEGADDAAVYDVWLRRIDETLRWEPLLARGKRNVLEFREMVARDSTGIATCTYFIVDSDYDGMRNFPDGPDIYVLPAYSVENYFVQPDVISAVLKTEFLLVGDPARTNQIVAVFQELTEEFCEILEGPCAKLHASKRSKSGKVVVNDDCMRHLSLDIQSVAVKDHAGIDQLITSEQDLSDTLPEANAFFNSISRSWWIRGKYVLSFCKQWLSRLADDRLAETPQWFVGRVHKITFASQNLTHGFFAAKSQLPDGLSKFVETCAARCKVACI